jgi:hypothetical protein
MVEQVVNALPKLVQKEIYDMVYESKILYKEFQHLLNNSNTENYQELSGILKKVLKNEILMRFLTKNKPFKKLYNSYFTNKTDCVNSCHALELCEVVQQFSSDVPQKGAEMNGLERLLCASSMRKCVKEDELYDRFTASLLVQKEKLYQ